MSFNRHAPLSLPLRSYQFVAPYWADVDTRGTGEIFYRQSTDPSLLARASLEITTALSINHIIEIKHLLIATWNAVGYYYSRTDKVGYEYNYIHSYVAYMQYKSVTSVMQHT